MSFIKSIFFICIMLLINSVIASDYPKTQLEKEMDEVGSLLGGEGIVFRPGKEKSQATKSKTSVVHVNKYLFQASLEVLKFAPLASADSKSGTIITDWYSLKEQKDVQFKVIVYIKEDIITPEGLEVIAFERKKEKNNWSEHYRSNAVSSVLEDKILRRARDLYLQSER